MKEWRAREAAFPMCLPTTLRILNPANLFCNMQCTTVCITAAGSRVAKRTPGTCPGGVCPSGFARQRLPVDPRGVFPGDLRVTESPRQPVGQPPESAATVTLTGRHSGSCKTGAAAGTHGPPHPLPVQVCRWEKDCLSSGYRDGLQVWRWSVY